MTKLKIFYHLTNLNGWHDIAVEQLDLLKQTGLMDAAEVNIHTQYDEHAFDVLKERYNDCSTINWIYNPEIIPKDHEQATAILMKQAADATDEEFYTMYLHQKGISHIGNPDRETRTKHWRWLLHYWNIEHWQDCVAQLDAGYEAVGCNYTSIPWTHFSGNIWWARASLIRRCKPLQLPSKIGYQTQGLSDYYLYDVESWHASAGNAKFCSLFQSSNVPGFHYDNEYPPENYR